MCLTLRLALKKIIRLEKARYRFCENCAHVRCFHPSALSPVYGVDLTSASAQVSQTLLQDSSLMRSLDGKILHFFLFCSSEKGVYSPINLQPKPQLCQAGWGPLVALDSGQLGALAEPLKDIDSVVPEPLRCCLGCVFRVIVLLEGEPSIQYEYIKHIHVSRPYSSDW